MNVPAGANGDTRTSMAVFEDAVREAVTERAGAFADQIASLGRMKYSPFAGDTALFDDAVREALTGPARAFADQIASLGRMKYSPFAGDTALFDDAVREALTGPARAFADQIASLGRMKYSPFAGDTALFDDAIREALTGPAQEFADQISRTSLAWLRSSSGQALEPVVYSDLVHSLMSGSEGSSRSDYEPIRIDGDAPDVEPLPAAMFERFEITIKSLQGLLSELDRLTRRLYPLAVSWRGQGNADWGLHSTLYRAVRSTRSRRRGSMVAPGAWDVSAVPNEGAMVAAEKYLLSEVGSRWRLANLPAVELLAKMQHRGVPTRLVDATRNPLLALWFAVSEQGDADARLFAIAHRPIPQAKAPRTRMLDQAIWADLQPFWFGFESPSERVVGAWGTGTRLREIVPPDYDKRILIQNAVFLLDGLPALTESFLELFNRVAGGNWTPADVASSMSIVLAPSDPSRSVVDDSDPLSLVYSFRIPARLKNVIRATLERTYGLNWETVYPDLEGVTKYLEQNPDWLALGEGGECSASGGS
ncbi:FRG domain-containing protein [Pseudactinotalea sp. HY158]|uniref:FRG domain-containing protein n=1 Tax=Pseudactinotalea sp. HY158 TaxID=2654547 RepID=UPI0018925130|nr:FRG domain-containing protein [Pseudactinotalea sp. HY158]